MAFHHNVISDEISISITVSYVIQLDEKSVKKVNMV